jgi:hypothetical protein
MGKGPVICLCWRTQYTARNNSWYSHWNEIPFQD